jgi:WD40 repeat protein
VLLASAAGKKVRLWNTAGELIREHADHPSTVADIQWKPGTLELATAAYGQVTLIDPRRAGPARALKWKGSQLALAWSPDGKYIATGDQDCTVHFWVMKSGEDLMMSGYPTKVRALSWDHTSRYLATGAGLGVCVWDVSGKGPAGRKPLEFKWHEGNVKALAFQHKGTSLASGSADGGLALWEPGVNRRSLAQAAVPSAITQVAWAPDDRRLAVGTDAGTVTLLALS